jgi:4-hydroxy-3-methylbut-2-enyl diphosphate reductase (EC 1.17.1.2)
VPVGSYLIFSAHGVSKQVQQEAKDRQLTVFDATCPLVTKVHIQVAKHAKSDREVILIGQQVILKSKARWGSMKNVLIMAVSI